ncbi:DUF4255 domain-containing protein [Primorskyibacter sp. 2E233]|uniref:DUF4255 domain-containing protein n=1 Tax=Primorskyibacter sp. 2E233 TaxID=3413431 RepID=UPI003BF08500
MSNVLAIPTVTAAFSRRLLEAASTAVNNANVRVGTPSAKLAEDANPLVNLHLFRVAPNPALVNAHLPTHNSQAGQVARAQLALDLNYVLTFYGSHDTYEPERMLSEVLLSMETRPGLGPNTVKAAIDNTAVLAGSDLDKALSRLRVTRQLHNIDEFSKIWSIFYQVPYAISLVYEVSHVVIEEQTNQAPSLPVAMVRNWVAPLANLRLDSATGPDGSLPVLGGTLVIDGQGLGKTGLGLEADGIALSGFAQSPERITLPLTAASFGGTAPKAGLHRVQAVMPGAPDQPAHLAYRSNAIAFALHPSIVPGAVTAPPGGDTATGSIKVTFSPVVGSDQEVRLLLDSRDPAKPGQVALPGRAPVPDGADAAQLDFDFKDLPRGTYLVRADVDGLVSPVTLDPATQQINGPEAAI